MEEAILDIERFLMQNYLPYAKGVIIDRAIPSIDGLKPSQRRVLYTMYTMGLLNKDKTKSANIVGQVMKLHPHGDMAIYETMVRLTLGHDALNCPYIESKGNFGKVFSKELKFAAPRYTEAKLAPICHEVFEDIGSNAVEFISNYDDTLKEPALLPVKFPSILVNPSDGIAVGMSSGIPSFNLKSVCEATTKILDGSITDVEGLMKVLGAPEFTTGGFLHASERDLNNLGRTGKGSFVISGTVTTYPNRIEITEIPYNTTSESIVDDIIQYAKSGELREVSDVNDNTDINGLKITVDLKRGANPHSVLQKLCRLTNLRKRIFFNTTVIIDNECREMGLLELLNTWIDFRLSCIKRIYECKLEKTAEKEHRLSAWEKIRVNLKDVANLIVNSSEIEARSKLMEFYSLDEIQADYILDMKVREFTNDRLLSRLKELQDCRDNMAEYNHIINDDNERKKVIIKELNEIITKYGAKPKTTLAAPIVEEAKEEEVKVSDAMVRIIRTEKGYIKRITSLSDMDKMVIDSDDKIISNVATRNNSIMMVFTYSGTVHKLLVDNIDASRGKVKDKLADTLMIKSSDIFFVDFTEDFSEYFNLVYPNGRGTRVYYRDASGKRSKYKNMFEAVEPGTAFITKADKFFLVTVKGSAAYADLSLLGKFSSRSAFKVARIKSGDRMCGLQPVDKVPDISKIDISRYSKQYTVKIGEDKLW